MLFNSLAYAIFLPVVFALYWALPTKFRWPLLLVASYYFYMSWNPKYVVLILLTTVVSYASALFVEKTESRKAKKGILAGALVICLGLLFVFKYFNFFSASVFAVLSNFVPGMHPVTLKLILPVGISFYTFQTLSYVIDVYKGETVAERNFGIYATFISFFPQLVAGPIERSSNLLPQIKGEHHFNYDKAMYGAKLMVIGFYKKLVIADVVAQYVDRVYADLPSYHGFDLAIAILFFTMQIYCDFSGYSDIAIGTAKMLDIDLMTNFRSPYYAASIKEFWSRWHISLSTWFRDYVYIPLGGNRCKPVRRHFNLMATFLLSGLWHGASWTFVVWGAIHGAMQVIENIFGKVLKPVRENRIGRWVSVLFVFVFANIAWVFFRAETFGDAMYVLVHVFDNITSPSAYLSSGLGMGMIELAIIMMTILVLFVYDYFNIDGQIIEKISAKNPVFQWVLYIVLGLMIVFLAQKGVAAEFVYFQF